MMQAMRDPRLTAVRPNGMPDQAEYKVDIDWEKAGTLGVPVPAIQRTISVAFGSAYVNDFIQGDVCIGFMCRRTPPTGCCRKI